TLSVSYPGIGLTADGLDVKWVISNAEILNEQTKTNEKGQASIELISKNPSTTSIKAIVNGIGISNAEKVASYTFAYPEGYVEIKQDDSLLGEIGLSDSNMIYFIIPGAAAGVFLFLKRTNRLEEITNRLPLGGLGEKFEEMKERVSEMRDRD
ncbi:MAG TPA: Ig-like domain-containing protein, partial [Nitrosopumilaceae archaeon]|nr:Ig-like domain-containing protein [Nitrosopumilaceae archaeon]